MDSDFNSNEKYFFLFLKKRLGKKITLNDSINQGKYELSDLDAFTFMEEFFNIFHIDDKNFIFTRYFDSDFQKKRIKINLEIKHLISVIEKKEWFDPKE